MKQEVLKGFPDIWMVLVALGLFVALFVGFVVYVYFIESKSSLNQKANLPFQIEEN